MRWSNKGYCHLITLGWVDKKPGKTACLDVRWRRTEPREGSSDGSALARYSKAVRFPRVSTLLDRVYDHLAVPVRGVDVFARSVLSGVLTRYSREYGVRNAEAPTFDTFAKTNQGASSHVFSF